MGTRHVHRTRAGIPARTLACVAAIALSRLVGADEAPAPDTAPTLANAPAPTETSSATTPKRVHAGPHAPAAHGLDHRMELLTKELGLDARQQTAVRHLLEGQRDQVLKVWADPAIAPPERAAAVRSVEDHTGDQIRALLTEPQQKKYNQPRPPPPPPANGAKSVDEWIDVLHGQKAN